MDTAVALDAPEHDDAPALITPPKTPFDMQITSVRPGGTVKVLVVTHAEGLVPDGQAHVHITNLSDDGDSWSFSNAKLSNSSSWNGCTHSLVNATASGSWNKQTGKGTITIHQLEPSWQEMAERSRR